MGDFVDRLLVAASMTQVEAYMRRVNGVDVQVRAHNRAVRNMSMKELRDTIDSLTGNHDAQSQNLLRQVISEKRRREGAPDSADAVEDARDLLRHRPDHTPRGEDILKGGHRGKYEISYPPKSRVEELKRKRRLAI